MPFLPSFLICSFTSSAFIFSHDGTVRRYGRADWEIPLLQVRKRQNNEQTCGTIFRWLIFAKRTLMPGQFLVHFTHRPLHNTLTQHRIRLKWWKCKKNTNYYPGACIRPILADWRFKEKETTRKKWRCQSGTGNCWKSNGSIQKSYVTHLPNKV